MVPPELVLVLSTYTFALLPWTLVYNFDFISERWKTIRETRRRGCAHLLALGLPLPLMVYYVYFQVIEEDYKEMSMGLVAILVSMYHVFRTLWGLLLLHWLKIWAINAHEKLEQVGYRMRFEAYGSTDGGGNAPEKTAEVPNSEVGAEELLVNSTLVDNEFFESHSSPVGVFLGGRLLLGLRRFAYRCSVRLRKEAGAHLIMDLPIQPNSFSARMQLLASWILSLVTELRPSQERPCQNLRRVCNEAIDFALTPEGAAFFAEYEYREPTSRPSSQANSAPEDGYPRGSRERVSISRSLPRKEFASSTDSDQKRRPQRRVNAKSALSLLRDPVRYQNCWFWVFPFPKDPEVTWVRWSVAFITQRVRKLVQDIPEHGLGIEQADRGRLIIGFCELLGIVPLETWRRFSGWLFEPVADCLSEHPMGRRRKKFVTGFSLRHALLESIFESGESLPFSYPSPIAMKDNEFLAVDPEELLRESIGALDRKYSVKDEFIKPGQLEFFTVACSNMGWISSGENPMDREKYLSKIKRALGLEAKDDYVEKELKELRSAVEALEKSIPNPTDMLGEDIRTLKTHIRKLGENVDKLGKAMRSAVQAHHLGREEGFVIEDGKFEEHRRSLNDVVRRIRACKNEIGFIRRADHVKLALNNILYSAQVVSDIADGFEKLCGRRNGEGNPDAAHVLASMGTRNDISQPTRRRSGTLELDRVRRGLNLPVKRPRNAEAIVNNRLGRRSSGLGEQLVDVSFATRGLPSSAGPRMATGNQERRQSVGRTARRPPNDRDSRLFVDNWVALRNGLECSKLLESSGSVSSDKIEVERVSHHKECESFQMEESSYRRRSLYRRLSCTETALKFNYTIIKKLGDSLIHYCPIHESKHDEGFAKCGEGCKLSRPPIPDKEVPIPYGKHLTIAVDKSVAKEIRYVAANLESMDPRSTPAYLKLQILRDIQEELLKFAAKYGSASFAAIAACILGFPALVANELCEPSVFKASSSRRSPVNDVVARAPMDLEARHIPREQSKESQVALQMEFCPVAAPNGLSVVTTFIYAGEQGSEIECTLQIRSRSGDPCTFNWQTWRDCIVKHIDSQGGGKEESRLGDDQRQDERPLSEVNLLSDVSQNLRRKSMKELNKANAWHGNEVEYEWAAWPGGPLLRIRRMGNEGDSSDVLESDQAATQQPRSGVENMGARRSSYG